MLLKRQRADFPGSQARPVYSGTEALYSQGNDPAFDHGTGLSSGYESEGLQQGLSSREPMRPQGLYGQGRELPPSSSAYDL